MACKGTLPSGDQCDAPDHQLNPATGLCGSCGAPKSMALVHLGGTTLLADPDVEMKYNALPPKAQAFLTAFVATRGKIGEASKVAGVSRNMHRYWLKTVTDYPEVFEVARLDVVDQWRDFYADLAENGLAERTFDADGKLERTRVRQDAATAKAQLMSLDPDFAPDRDRGSDNVVIILNHTNEGGWTEPTPEATDQVPEVEVIEGDEAPVEKHPAGDGVT